MTEIKQTMAEVQAEARRCLYCVDAPCQQGCPAGVDVAQFIRHLRYADVKSAKRVIKTANPLGGICGTLCPSENLCQKNCTMNYCGAPIHIRDLQKFACANAAYTPELAPASGKKAAVVGAGPAGLGCAAMLARWTCLKRTRLPPAWWRAKFRPSALTPPWWKTIWPSFRASASTSTTTRPSRPRSWKS